MFNLQQLNDDAKLAAELKLEAPELSGPTHIIAVFNVGVNFI